MLIFIISLSINKFYEKNINSIFFKDDSTIILNSENRFIELNLKSGIKKYSYDFDFKITKMFYLDANYVFLIERQFIGKQKESKLVFYDPILNLQYPIVTNFVTDFTIDKEKKFLYYTSFNNFIYRYLIKDKKYETFFVLPNAYSNINKIEFANDNLYIFTNDGFYVLNIIEKKIVNYFKYPLNTKNFAVSPSGSILAINTKRETIEEIIFKSEEISFSAYRTTKRIDDFAFSYDGRLFVILTNKNEILVFSVTDSFSHPELIECANCKFINNKWEYKFCINCGDKLEDEKKSIKAKYFENIIFTNLKEQPYEEIVEKETIKKDTTKIDTTTIKTENKIIEKTIETNVIIQPKVEKPKKEFPIISSPNFFEVPKSEILRQYTLYFSGGGSFATSEEGRTPFGISEMGFGDLFQIEFSSLGLISSITRGSMLIPTLGFKYNITNTFKGRIILPEKFPSIAIGIKGSWWNTITKDNISYKLRHAFLFLTFQENISNFNTAVGLSVCDTRIKTSFMSSEIVSNPFLLFLGTEIKINNNTFLVFEASQVSGYRLQPNGIESEDDLIIGYWLSLGGKCYVFKWLTVNSGIRIDSPAGEIKWTGLSDVKLWAGINLLFPLDYYLGF